jgi:phosphoribosylformylglycinamidine cyclo-ligase
MKKSLTYKQAGVDIEEANKSLQQVKKTISETHNSRVLKNIGAFGGFYEFPTKDFKQPVLIASTDGVGTKLLVAMRVNIHDTVGQDLVNHCINDIAVCGAKPLFFLDYFGCGKFDTRVFQQIINGFVKACKDANLPLIGGETAEMPDLYQPGEYDLAGTIVGVVERDQIIDGQSIVPGDVMLGVASNGLHTNGYSLARKILFSKYQPDDYEELIKNRIADELLKVHLNYFPVIEKLVEKFPVKGLAHITGGGLAENTLRVLPDGLIPEFDWGSWSIHPIFTLIESIGSVPQEDMRRTFNLGIGLVVIVDEQSAPEILSFAKNLKIEISTVGKIVKNH